MASELYAIDKLSNEQQLTISRSAPSWASYLRVDRSSLLGKSTMIARWYDDEDEELYENPSADIYDAIEHLECIGEFWAAIDIDELDKQ